MGGKNAATEDRPGRKSSFRQEADPDAALAGESIHGQGVIPLNELAGLFALQALRCDSQAIHLDVEVAVAFPAPIGCAQQQRLLAHGGVEFEEAAGARIASRPEPVGNGVGNIARERMRLLVACDAEPDDVE